MVDVSNYPTHKQTYEPIATQTLSAAASSVTFSNIPQTFKDLILYVSCPGASTQGGIRFRVNNDSGSNYSYTIIEGNGTSAYSQRYSNDSAGATAWNSSIDTTWMATAILHFMSYKNTNAFKTMLALTDSPSSVSSNTINLWRSTSAITSITIGAGGGFPTSMTFSSGSTFSLYGIAG